MTQPLACRWPLMSALLVLGMCWSAVARVQAATLDQFELESRGNQVTIKLQGTGEAIEAHAPEPYQGGTAITLPNTQLSPKLVEQGLPVVMDGQSRFIGRAVPAGNNQVRILLPNVPAKGYQIDVQSSTNRRASATSEPPTRLENGPSYGEVITLQPAGRRPQTVESLQPIKPQGPLPQVMVSPSTTHQPVAQLYRIEPPATVPPQSAKSTRRKVTRSKPRLASQAKPLDVKSMLKKALVAPAPVKPLPAEPVTPAEALWNTLPVNGNEAGLTPDLTQDPTLAAAELLYLDMPSAMLEPMTPALRPSLSNLFNLDWYMQRAIDVLEQRLDQPANQSATLLPWLIASLLGLGLSGLVIGLWVARRRQLAEMSPSTPATATVRLPFSLDSISLKPQLRWASAPRRLPFEMPRPEALPNLPRVAPVTVSSGGYMTLNKTRLQAPPLPRVGRPGVGMGA